jgi:folate-dependent phosphoribosylglycinamide formyltransferase PurN
VLDGDTAETLAARVLGAEHRLYPDCLAKAALSLQVVRPRQDRPIS